MGGPESGETCLYNTCTLLYIALSPASFFNDMKKCRSGWPDAYPRFLSVCEIVIFLVFCSLEVMGRFPTAGESREMNIDVNTPIWLPADQRDMTPEVKKRMQLLRDYTKCFKQRNI